MMDLPGGSKGSIDRDIIVGYGGFKFRILFYKYGYTPHYAEHIVDPIDGREKLVLAIPHTTPSRGKVVILDLEDGRVEWEVSVPEGPVFNPHMAHMISEINPLTGSWVDVATSMGLELGDVVAPSRDNSWVVFDRRTKAVKRVVKPGFDARWVHDIIPSVNGDGFIVSDYGVGFYKIRFDGSTVWGPLIGSGAAKISFIESTTPNWHSPSFGGRYLLVRNRDVEGVYEVDDSGNVVWRCASSPGGVNVFWPFTPHSAFRTGVAELGGQLTIVGFEAGGGIVALDRDCRPRWGVMKGFSVTPSTAYRPTSFGLLETTHVFPTLRGTIGFIDWGGKYGSVVGEILEIPYHQTLWFILAQDHDPGDAWHEYNPPIEVGEWRETKIVISANPGGPLEYAIYGTNIPYIHGSSAKWKQIARGTVNPEDYLEVDVSGNTFIKITGRRAVTGTPSSWKIIVILRR